LGINIEKFLANGWSYKKLNINSFEKNEKWRRIFLKRDNDVSFIENLLLTGRIFLR